MELQNSIFSNLDRKYLALGAVSLLIVLSLSWYGLQSLNDLSQTQNVDTEVSEDCEEDYDNIIEGNMEVKNLSEDCKPVPEKASNQILLNKLEG